MSIPANIVEGRAKTSEKEIARFLKISLSSSTELEYHLIVAKDVGAIDRKAFLSMLEQILEVRMMLHGLLKKSPLRSLHPPRRTVMRQSAPSGGLPLARSSRLSVY
jgi:hypothetical protein